MSHTEFSSTIGAVQVGVRRADTVVVRISGEQDVSNVVPLRAALAAAGRAGAPTVVVDLSAATFVSAALIGAVADAEETLRRHGAHLRLRSPSVLAGRLLASCGLAPLLEGPEGGTGAPLAAAERSGDAGPDGPRPKVLVGA